MIICGVDPGAHGALAWLDGPRLIRVEDMPALKIRRGKSDKSEVDGWALAVLLSEMKADIGIIEQVGGMTGQSASAAFNFGRACGAPEYAMKALGWRVEFVPPARWKSHLRLNSGKDGSRAMACRLWPDKAKWFARVKDNDRAEAALIAEWFRRQQSSYKQEDANVWFD